MDQRSKISKRKCSCGCGSWVYGNSNSTGKPLKFVWGHNRKGIKHTPEAVAKMSGAHTGLSQSLEHRQAISKALKGNEPWNAGKTYEQVLGKEKSLEMARKQSEAMRGRKYSEEHCEKIRQARLRYLSSGYTPNLLTRIERVMYEELERRGISFNTQVIIGKYCVDFLIGRIIIECDGNYWHSGLVASIRDRIRDMELGQLGHIVLRFTGREINYDVGGCVSKVLDILDYDIVRTADISKTAEESRNDFPTLVVAKV